jgi:putative phosphoribosyl transferase
MQLSPSAAHGAQTPVETRVIVPIGLQGDLSVPDDARGIVVFAHGSGSSRLSPRNAHVAAALREEEIGTLLFDLLTPQEAEDRRNVFDIDLLAARLLIATRWLQGELGPGTPPVAYFGASTGAAAALFAAASAGNDIAAVVSRGGRPDLVGDMLRSVRAPTLLIVGQNDADVLMLNREALGKLTCEKKLALVPGASHLFEEPGALDAVIDLACRWFADHFSQPVNG